MNFERSKASSVFHTEKVELADSSLLGVFPDFSSGRTLPDLLHVCNDVSGKKRLNTLVKGMTIWKYIYEE